MVERKEEKERRKRTTKTSLSNARVAFDVSLFSCERFLRSKRVRARFVTPSPNALTNASGFVSDDDDANDKQNKKNKSNNEKRSTGDERAIAFVDESSGIVYATASG